MNALPDTSSTGGIVFTGGGTAGHVFPGIAVIQSLSPDIPVAWIGGRGGMEHRLLERKGIRFYGIQGGKLRRYFSLKNITDLGFIIIGFLQSWRLLRNIRPRLVFSKGGYISVPVVLMASLLRIPVISHESDLLPGMATCINLRFSHLLYTSWTATRKYITQKYRHRVRYVGNPVRNEFLSTKKTSSHSRFRLLILGGSLGCRQINRLLGAVLDQLLVHCEVIHQYGSYNLIPATKPGYQVFPFLNEELFDYLREADLVVSRAGAGTLSEIAFLGKPSILIPLGENASRGEQIYNAQFFAEKNAALVLSNPSPEDLREAILSITNSEKIRSEMAEAARALSNPQAATRLAYGLTLWRKYALV